MWYIENIMIYERCHDISKNLIFLDHTMRCIGVKNNISIFLICRIIVSLYYIANLLCCISCFRLQRLHHSLPCQPRWFSSRPTFQMLIVFLYQSVSLFMSQYHKEQFSTTYILLFFLQLCIVDLYLLLCCT